MQAYGSRFQQHIPATLLPLPNPSQAQGAEGCGQTCDDRMHVAASQNGAANCFDMTHPRICDAVQPDCQQRSQALTWTPGLNALSRRTTASTKASTMPADTTSSISAAATCCDHGRSTTAVAAASAPALISASASCALPSTWYTSASLQTEQV